MCHSFSTTITIFSLYIKGNIVIAIKRFLRVQKNQGKERLPFPLYRYYKRLMFSYTNNVAKQSPKLLWAVSALLLQS